MKRRGIVALLAAVMVIAGSVFCYADTDGLELLSTYPENGQENTSMENVGVKLRFNHPVNSKAAKKVDSKVVKLVDEDGKAVPSQILFSDKNDGLVLVLADTTDYRVKNNAKYTVKIGADFVDNDGHVLGSDQEITFKTYNQSVNNIVNMAMMVVMFGGIMFVTMKQQKEKEAEEKDTKTKEAAFNPYKEAKRTGKTVQEVIDEENKRQAKLAKKNKKKGDANSKGKERIICADYLNNVYHVHAPAPIHKTKKKK